MSIIHRSGTSLAWRDSACTDYHWVKHQYVKSTRLDGQKKYFYWELWQNQHQESFISFSLWIKPCEKGFEKYSLIACPKYLYLFACALSLIYRRGSRLLPQLLVTTIASPTRPKGTLIAGPALLIHTKPGRRYHYCYPVITASRVWAWDSNPALRHKLPILSQTAFSNGGQATNTTAAVITSSRLWSIFHATSDHRHPFS